MDFLKRIMIVATLMSLLIACSASGEEKSEEEVSESAIQNEGPSEMLFKIDTFEYDQNTDQFSLRFSTNLPDDTPVIFRMGTENADYESGDGVMIEEESARVYSGTVTKYEFHRSLSSEMPVKDTTYLLDVEVPYIEGETPENLSSLDYSNVSVVFADTANGFELKQADSIVLGDEHLTELIEEETIAKPIKLSEEFANYNEGYYTALKNQLDLIGSNFELVYEDLHSPLLLEDLVRWTKEFNELLDIYEQKAAPVTEKDQELYAITQELIENQRKANEKIIQGLEESDDLSLVIASQYIDTVVDLYLKGYDLVRES
ncbi:hypothetical protein EQV77_17515 [Halobacillus fulvus]|nr:hypothetical protein EQV77_17515 [Halobacillus fulvus]